MLRLRGQDCRDGTAVGVMSLLCNVNCRALVRARRSAGLHSAISTRSSEVAAAARIGRPPAPSPSPSPLAVEFGSAELARPAIALRSSCASPARVQRRRRSCSVQGSAGDGKGVLSRETAVGKVGATEREETGKNMAKESVAEELVAFINAAPSAFHAVHEAKTRLKDAGYLQLSERETWKLEQGGKYYFTRNHSTIVAFAVGKRFEAGKGFLAIGAHTDSPCPKLKPVSKVARGGFLELGVQTYGGGLWHTWFDRDLTVAGRVVVKRKGADAESFSHELVRIRRPILRIPSLAIHLDKTVLEQGFKVNTQTQLVPILATAIKEEASKSVPSSAGEANGGADKPGPVLKSVNHHPLLLQLLAEELNCRPEDISTFDLDVVDTQPSTIGGALNEFIFSARLDNLCSSFCSLKALIDATASADSLNEECGVRMIALFDHEEIGSNSAQGAGSPILVDALRRITTHFIAGPSLGLFEQALQHSFLVSADMAHGLHPNYQEKYEENHQPKIHSGIVIKHNANQRYATSAVTAFLFREIGERNQLPTQDFVVRNDMSCGSTIGPILASGIGIRTVDVGTPQLSMHSVREMCGVDDVRHSYMHFKAFFETFSDLDSKLRVDS